MKKRREELKQLLGNPTVDKKTKEYFAQTGSQTANQRQVMREIVFILEPDMGRVTVESSQADAKIAKEISKDLGQGSVVNCARPKPEIENSFSRNHC